MENIRLSVKDLAVKLGVSNATIYNWLKNGLPALRHPLDGVTIDEKEARQWLDSQATPYQPREKRQEIPAVSRLRVEAGVEASKAPKLAFKKIASHKQSDEKKAVYKGTVHKAGLDWIVLDIEGVTKEVKVKKADPDNVGTRLHNAGLVEGQEIVVFTFVRVGEVAIRDFQAPGILFK